LKSKQIILQR